VHAQRVGDGALDLLRDEDITQPSPDLRTALETVAAIRRKQARSYSTHLPQFREMPKASWARTVPFHDL
jgi:hypothetical protein